MLKKNGWIFIDKPIGLTSNALLQQVKLNAGKVKAGFVGTLDPLASGFLPIAIGRATKVINLIENFGKKYVFTILWGTKTNTGDLEGEVIKKKKNFPTQESIKKIIKRFQGKITQVPPNFSSIKINGRRAYELARKNNDFQLRKRIVEIHELKLLKQLSEKKAEFFVECSTGTYVRTLAEKIAESLDTIGVVAELRRVGFGNFNKNLISLDYFLSLVHSDDLNSAIEPIDKVFDWIDVIKINEKQLNKVLKGNCVEMNFFQNSRVRLKNSHVVFAKHDDEIVALGFIKKQNFYPKKILVS